MQHIQCNAIQFSIMQCNASKFKAMQCTTIWWYNTIWYNMLDTIQYDMIQYDKTRQDTTWYNTIQYKSQNIPVLSTVEKIGYDLIIQIVVILVIKVWCTIVESDLIHLTARRVTQGQPSTTTSPMWKRKIMLGHWQP